MANSFQNVGILNQSGFFTRSALADVVVDGFAIDPSILAQLTPGDGDVAAVDPDFNIPSTWKFNIAWDQEFDIGKLKDFRFTADLLFASVKDAPVWIDLRREVIGHAADGRPIYGAVGCASDPATVDPIAECRDIFNFDILMTNTSKGKNNSYSFTLAKEWDWRSAGELSTQVSYTYQDADAISDALSSTPTSLIGREQTSDRNNNPYGRSSFETTNRLNATITWRKTFFDRLVTTLSFFIQRQSGKPYGYTYDAPSNSLGDTFGGNEPIDDDDTQLLYVPTGPDDPNVIFGSGFDMDAFEALVDSESCLGKFRGKIAEKNSCTSPHTTRVDMRFIQEFRLPRIGFLGDSAFEFIVDVENLGNLINSDWGRVELISFPFTKNVVTLNNNLGPNGELIYDRFRDENFTVFNTASLWKIQLGVRYRF